MSVTSNAVWLAACRIAADASGVALFAAVSRAFGPAGAGAYSYAYAIGSLAAILASSELEEYGIREYARSAPPSRRALWADLLAAQAVQLALGSAALAVYLLAAPAVDAGSVVALASFLIGWGVARTLFVPAMAAQRMAGPALAELACRMAASLGTMAALALLAPPLRVALLAFPSAAVLLVLAAAWNARRHGASLSPPAGTSWRGAGGTLRAAASFTGSELLSQFYARADVLMIAYLAGAEGVGIYAAGVKFVEVGLVPLVLLGTAAYPLLSRAAETDQLLFRAAARDLLATVLFLGGLLAIGLAYVVPLLAVPLLGDRFVPVAPILPWLALLALLKAGEIGAYRLLYAVRRQGAYLRGLLIGTAVNVTLNLALIRTLAVTGAVIAALVSCAVINLACGLALRRHLVGCGIRELVSALAAGLAGTLAAALAAGLAGAGPWLVAATACLAYPVLGRLVGLAPDPRRTPLLGRHNRTIAAETAHTSPGKF